MIRTVFFDLFSTLIYPRYPEKSEYEMLGIPVDEWETYAEDASLYFERALGKTATGTEIIRKIADKMPFELDEMQQKEILRRREERMKTALVSVDGQILDTLARLRERDIRLCLISNADRIDCKYWGASPLAPYFDAAVFSCDVGMLKPDEPIYRYAMEQMKAKPAESLFVGDGGFDELYGAQRVGMRTVFTEYLEAKSGEKRERIRAYADYHMTEFADLLKFVS